MTAYQCVQGCVSFNHTCARYRPTRLPGHQITKYFPAPRPEDPKGRCAHGQWQSMAKPFSSPLLPSKMRRLRCRRQTVRLYWKNLFPPLDFEFYCRVVPLLGDSKVKSFSSYFLKVVDFDCKLDLYILESVDSIDSMPLSCHEIF
jgi:hypothetical protein